MKMKTQQPKTYEIISKSSAKGKVHSNTILPQETREKSNKYPNFTLKATIKKKERKKEMKNTRISRRKKNHKN